MGSLTHALFGSLWGSAGVPGSERSVPIMSLELSCFPVTQVVVPVATGHFPMLMRLIRL